MGGIMGTMATYQPNYPLGLFQVPRYFDRVIATSMPIARVTGGTWLESQIADFFLAIAGLTALAHL